MTILVECIADGHGEVELFLLERITHTGVERQVAILTESIVAAYLHLVGNASRSTITHVERVQYR